ncbi:hypothetical protein [Dictyobacter kobayashii]|nr:hypothetical protein [Dictyobacter kobayashii]
MNADPYANYNAFSQPPVSRSESLFYVSFYCAYDLFMAHTSQFRSA